MTALWVIVATGLAVVLQTLLAPWHAAARVVDPFLVVAMVAGLTLRRVPALLTGLFVGLVQDTWWSGSGWLGLHAFTKVTLAYAASALGTRLDVSQSVPRLIVLGVASAADRALQLGLGAALGREGLEIEPWPRWLLAALTTVVLGLLSFAVVDRVRGRRR